MRAKIPGDLRTAIRDDRIREQAVTMRLVPNHWECMPPVDDAPCTSDSFTRWLAGIERLGYKLTRRPEIRWYGDGEPRMPRWGVHAERIWASRQLPQEWSPVPLPRGAVPVPMRPETLRRIAEGLRRYERPKSDTARWLGEQLTDALAAEND